MKRSLLYENSNSPLDTQSVLRPKKKKSAKLLGATLVLTSLVDAFSILVIYLMVNTSSGVQVDVNENIELPQASQSTLLDAGLLVQITPDGILIDQEKISLDQLVSVLKEKREALEQEDSEQAKKLILQADKASDFEKLNPVVLAGTQSGFENIVFAVLQKGEGK